MPQGGVYIAATPGNRAQPGEGSSMSSRRYVPAALICFTTLLSVARADTPSPLLGFIPQQADLLVEVPDPGRVIHALLDSDTLAKLLELGPVKENLAGTKA